MSLTNRLTNLELIMAAKMHHEMLSYQEDSTFRQLQEVLCTFNEEKSPEIYRRGAARKRLEFDDMMDCDSEESSADFESSFKRVGIADDFPTPAQFIKPMNFEQLTKQERGLVRDHATISMEEDDVDTYSGQFKRRRCQ